MYMATLLVALFAFQAATVALGQDKQKQKTETLKCWASLDCEKCVEKVEKNISFEKGVTDLKVDLPTKLITITYKPSKTSPDKLEKAIQKLGYKTEIVNDKK